jgi:hypothetical protein
MASFIMTEPERRALQNLEAAFEKVLREIRVGQAISALSFPTTGSLVDAKVAIERMNKVMSPCREGQY